MQPRDAVKKIGLGSGAAGIWKDDTAQHGSWVLGRGSWVLGLGRWGLRRQRDQADCRDDESNEATIQRFTSVQEKPEGAARPRADLFDSGPRPQVPRPKTQDPRTRGGTSSASGA